MDTVTHPCAERFWSGVRRGLPNECWPWARGCDSWGYGAFHAEGRQIGSHRFAWVLTHGTIPRGLLVLHKCDNPPCCNPTHLFLGTSADNMSDKCRKGRAACGYAHSEVTRHSTPRGEQHGNAKLRLDQVESIRRLPQVDCNISRLARVYNVSRAQIKRIRNGSSWKSTDEQITSSEEANANHAFDSDPSPVCTNPSSAD